MTVARVPDAVCVVMANVVCLQESVDVSERDRYRELMEVIGWFFFDLLILGYVEDPDTGLSFRMPGDLAWAIYIEVSWKRAVTIVLHLFYVCVFHIYILYLSHTHTHSLPRFPLVRSKCPQG